jgi:hypothetical protein
MPQYHSDVLEHHTIGGHHVTICLEGLVDVAAFYWLTSMVENNP